MGHFIETTKPTKAVRLADLGRRGTSFIQHKLFAMWTMDRLITRSNLTGGDLDSFNILDLGMGRGDLGWRAKRRLGHPLSITGVEVYPDYIKGSARIYDKIFVGSINEALSEINLEEYNLISLIDVLEHHTIADAHVLLSVILSLGKHFIMATPNFRYRQSEVDGNPYEEHLSYWDIELVLKYRPSIFYVDDRGRAAYYFSPNMSNEACNSIDVETLISSTRSVADSNKYMRDIGIPVPGCYSYDGTSFTLIGDSMEFSRFMR